MGLAGRNDVLLAAYSFYAIEPKFSQVVRQACSCPYRTSFLYISENTDAIRGVQVMAKINRQRGSSVTDNAENPDFIGLTANIVSAYVSNNTVPATDIPSLINQVHAALRRVTSGQPEGSAEPPKPAVPVKRSITPEHLICLEDGKKFKSLKRHLRTRYGMTPERYREKWGLSMDYPMVAPNYAAARSQLAKQMGLGQQRRRRR